MRGWELALPNQDGAGDCPVMRYVASLLATTLYLYREVDCHDRMFATGDHPKRANFMHPRAYRITALRSVRLPMQGLGLSCNAYWLAASEGGAAMR